MHKVPGTKDTPSNRTHPWMATSADKLAASLAVLKDIQDRGNAGELG